MKIREKLAYMALGGVLVIAGMLLSDFTSVANAQFGVGEIKLLKDLLEELQEKDIDGNKIHRFRTIDCHGIRIRDKQGKLHMFLGQFSNAPYNHGMTIYDPRNGEIVFQIQRVYRDKGFSSSMTTQITMFDTDPKGRVNTVQLGTRTHRSGNDQKGDGFIRIYDKNSSILFEK